MALATQADVEAALGRDLAESERTRVPSLLTKATGIVLGYTRQDYTSEAVPETVTVVIADMVARVVTAATVAPVLPEQQSAGPFSVRYSAAATSGGPYLTAADKLALRPYRKGGGVTSVQLVGERYNVTPDEV